MVRSDVGVCARRSGRAARSSFGHGGLETGGIEDEEGLQVGQRRLGAFVVVHLRVHRRRRDSRRWRSRRRTGGADCDPGTIRTREPRADRVSRPRSRGRPRPPPRPAPQRRAAARRRRRNAARRGGGHGARSAAATDRRRRALARTSRALGARRSPTARRRAARRRRSAPAVGGRCRRPGRPRTSTSRPTRSFAAVSASRSARTPSSSVASPPMLVGTAAGQPQQRQTPLCAAIAARPGPAASRAAGSGSARAARGPAARPPPRRAPTPRARDGPRRAARRASARSIRHEVVHAALLGAPCVSQKAEASRQHPVIGLGARRLSQSQARRSPDAQRRRCSSPRSAVVRRRRRAG